MKQFLILPFVCLCLAISTNSNACDQPNKPDLPKGRDNTEQEMMTAKEDVDGYLAQANAYLECTKSDKNYNRMVKDMQNLGLKFNLALRRYNKSQSKV